MTSARVREIDAGDLHFSELSIRVREALDAGAAKVILWNVCGQRYIGAGLMCGAEITINGIPGNDLGCFMAGPRLVVKGNAQDGVANTMNAGEIIIHGDAGDVLGYAMRGGRVFVRGNAGYRIGIHMKAFQNCKPVIVIGGTAQDYFGEYMAGGTLVVLGLERRADRPLVGDFFGSGMHGGEIFIRGEVDQAQFGKEVGAVDLTDQDWERLSEHLAGFAREFNIDQSLFARRSFTRLAPVSHRPYGRIYIY